MIRTTFLGKSYEYSDDLIKYIKILDMTKAIHTELFGYAKDAAIKDKFENAKIEMKDILPQLYKQAEKYITLLCDSEVYNRSIDELVLNSHGYLAVEAAINTTLDSIKKVYADSVNEIMDGMQSAQSDAQSKVMGTGVEMLTNSKTTLLTHSALEYLTINSQIKSAQSDYKEEINKILDKSSDRLEKRCKVIIRDIYLPNMYNSLGEFVLGMMNNCLSDMNAAGTFDSTVLEYVDYKRSNDLLKNLSLSNNEEAVIKAAYETCPLNINVYVECAKRDKLTEEMVSFLITIGKKDSFTKEIERIYKTALDKSNDIMPNREFIDFFNKYTGIIKAWAGVHDKAPDYYNNEIGASVYKRIITEYDFYRKCLQNDSKAIKWYERLSDDEIISMTEEQVKELVGYKIETFSISEVFGILIEKCGYSTLLSDIAHPDIDEEIIKKETIDAFYAEKCSELISSYLPSIKRKIEDMKYAFWKRQADETAVSIQLEKKKMNTKVCLQIVFAIICIIPLVIHFVQVKNYVSKVEAEVNKLVQDNLSKELRDRDSYASEYKVKNKYKITTIDFYDGYIVPNITFYSDSSDVWSVGASLVMSDLLPFHEPSKTNKPFGTLGLFSSDSSDIIGNGVLIDDTDEEYHTSLFTDYYHYEEINIYTCGNWKLWYVIFVIVDIFLYKKIYKALCKRIDDPNQYYPLYD